MPNYGEPIIVTVWGDVVNDAHSRTLPNSSCLATFTLAASQHRGASETQWHRIQAWGAMARYAQGKVKKGSRVSVTGRLLPTPSTGHGDASVRELVAYQVWILEGNRADTDR